MLNSLGLCYHLDARTAPLAVLSHLHARSHPAESRGRLLKPALLSLLSRKRLTTERVRHYPWATTVNKSLFSSQKPHILFLPSRQVPPVFVSRHLDQRCPLSIPMIGDISQCRDPIFQASPSCFSSASAIEPRPPRLDNGIVKVGVGIFTMINDGKFEYREAARAAFDIKCSI